MRTPPVRFALALLLSMTIAGGALWSFAGRGNAAELAFRATCEAEDANGAETDAATLPLAVLTIEQLFFSTHCHGVVPVEVTPTLELLLSADNSPRGPPHA